MNLIGKKVKHKKFGVGTIFKQEPTYIYVDFNGEEKTFSYPSAINKFIELIDVEYKEEKVGNIKSQSKQEVQSNVDQNDLKQNIRFIRKNMENTLNTVQNQSVKTFTSVASFCGAYKSAIDDEVFYIRKTGGKRQRLFDGRIIEIKNG